MSKLRSEPAQELADDELALAVGGSTPLWSQVTLGSHPGHNYGVQSDSFHAPSFSDANTLLQRYNAPTYQGLYGPGNDPNAAFGTISRPGAQDLHGSYIAGIPADSGGNVTLQHGDGYAVNTTIDGQHPLEGSISRNLVVDLHDGSFSALTLGRGSDGARLASTIGEGVGDTVGHAAAGVPGGMLGGQIGSEVGQNVAHEINPGLGNTAFGQLDRAMIADANHQPNPNLDAPSGRWVEGAYSLSALVDGGKAAAGYGAGTYGATEQQHTLNEVAHSLNEQGPVQGYFVLGKETPGVYFMTPQGSHYYELDNNGRPVERQVDEFAGVDHAIQINAQSQQPSTPAGDFQVPLPPQINELAPELTPPSNGASPFDSGAGHGSDSSAPDTGAGHAGSDGGPHSDAGTGPVTVAANDTGHTDTGAIHVDDSASHVDTTPSSVSPPPVYASAPPPPVIDTPPPVIDIPPPVIDIPPPVIDIPPPVTAPPTISVASTDPIPITVSPPANPVVDTGPTGDPGGGGGGSFDVAGDFDTGGFEGGGDIG